MGETVRTDQSRIRRVILVAVVLVLAASGTTLGLLLTQSSTPVAQVAQLASVQTACKQWLSTNPGQPGTVQWCSEMSDWMSRYMDRYGMGPQMMWGDPNHMLSTCERWMAETPPSGSKTTSRVWCGSMVAWMSAHIGSWSGHDNWGDWMTHGPMMG
jgi:hypothetical protein